MSISTLFLIRVMGWIQPFEKLCSGLDARRADFILWDFQSPAAVINGCRAKSDCCWDGEDRFTNKCANCRTLPTAILFYSLELKGPSLFQLVNVPVQKIWSIKVLLECWLHTRPSHFTSLPNLSNEHKIPTAMFQNLVENLCREVDDVLTAKGHQLLVHGFGRVRFPHSFILFIIAREDSGEIHQLHSYWFDYKSDLI